MDLIAGKVVFQRHRQCCNAIDSVVLARVDVEQGHGLAMGQGREKMGKQRARSMMWGMSGGLTSSFSSSIRRYPVTTIASDLTRYKSYLSDVYAKMNKNDSDELFMMEKMGVDEEMDKLDNCDMIDA